MFLFRIKFTKPSLSIAIEKRQAVIGELLYHYLDNWSNPNTWGGENPPLE